MADNAIAITFFSPNNHFLLAVSRTNPGLIQLCMYEANKGQKFADTEKLKETTGVDKVVKGDGTDTGSDKMMDHDKNTKGMREQSKQTKVWRECLSRDDVDLGPTLEMQYLEFLGHEADVYAQPKKFDLREEQIILPKWLFWNRKQHYCFFMLALQCQSSIILTNIETPQMATIDPLFRADTQYEWSWSTRL